MTILTFSQPNFTTQTAEQYKTNLDASMAVVATIGGAYAPHQFGRADITPNMTVQVDAGSLFVAGSLVANAQQNTSVITAPTTNPRIDRVVIDATTGVVSVVTGTPAVSPVAPAIPAGKLPCARVLLQTTSTAITNSMITDERAFASPPSVFVIDRKTTTVDVVNTVTETDLYRFTVPGGMLGTVGKLRLTLISDLLNNTGGIQGPNLRVKYGATTVFVTSTLGMASNVDRRPVHLICELAAKGASNAQVAQTTARVGAATPTPGAGMVVAANEHLLGVHATVAEDSTIAKDLVVTCTLSAANALLSNRMLEAMLEVLP